MKKYDLKALINRIIQVRSEYSGSRGMSEFSRALNISPSTYSYYEKNRMPPIDMLIRICEITGVDIKWLITGEYPDDKEKSDINISLMRKITSLLAKSPQLKGAISAFVDLLAEKQKMESSFSDYAVETRGKTAKALKDEKSNRQTTRPGWIPVLGRTAAGVVSYWQQVITEQPKEAVTRLDQLIEKHIGRNIVNCSRGKIDIDLPVNTLSATVEKAEVSLVMVSTKNNEDIPQFIQCEEIYNRFPDSFALFVDGDSMSPRINDGDIVILSPTIKAVQGQVTVIQLKDQIGVTCKLIRFQDDHVHLIPINEKYEIKVVAKKNIIWSLAVLCHIRI